ncbi:MAG: DUF998 domain-containing protein [Betaproteobacteria bacterium]
MASLSGVALFVVTVVALHLLQPDYQPTQQLMSELALGPHGGTMIVAFLGLALAVFGIQAEVAAAGAPWGFRILLCLASFLFLASGVFPLGDTSEIHIGAISGAFVLSVLAMYLFPSSAGRASVAAPRALSWSLAIGVAASVALGHSILPMGIGQRLAAACLVAWLAVVGWRLLRAAPATESGL